MPKYALLFRVKKLPNLDGFMEENYGKSKVVFDYFDNSFFGAKHIFL